MVTVDLLQFFFVSFNQNLIIKFESNINVIRMFIQLLGFVYPTHHPFLIYKHFTNSIGIAWIKIFTFLIGCTWTQFIYNQANPSMENKIKKRSKMIRWESSSPFFVCFNLIQQKQQIKIDNGSTMWRLLNHQYISQFISASRFFFVFFFLHSVVCHNVGILWE